ncbi:hypothetical protein [Leeuwenhoekiella marinoflava]|uniref:hypothetical protein n=1 Tax=Leeuwenhoekiella marinoflava TaxID=988 RepID=UPI003AB94B8E
MGSALDLIAQQNNSAYISSKHGIHGLTKATDVEYGKQISVSIQLHRAILIPLC